MNNPYYTFTENNEFVFLKIRNCKETLVQKEMWPLLKEGLDALAKKTQPPTLSEKIIFAAKIIFNKIVGFLKLSCGGICLWFSRFADDLVIPPKLIGHVLSQEELMLFTKTFAHFDKQPVKE